MGKTLLQFVHFLSATTSHEGGGELAKIIPDIVERAGDDDLHGRYLIRLFINGDVANAEALSEKAIQHFRNAGNRSGEGA